MFAQSINGTYVELLKSPSIDIQHAAQILIDLSYLQAASEKCSTMLASMRYSHKNFVVKLAAPSVFRKTISSSKDVVCRLLNGIIDEHFALAEVDKATTEAESAASIAHLHSANLFIICAF